MQNFMNSECPYCGKKFVEGDDIVVCPECGTPHHRACYKEHGKCSNSERHGSFEWSAAPEPKRPEPFNNMDPSAQQSACPVCGTSNLPGAHYCVGCGSPIGGQPYGNYRNTVGPSPEEAFQRERERVFTQTFENTNFDGVSAKEAALVVRTNVEYFLIRFRAFASGRKMDTNFSAFLFSYFYLFYRKMYGLGIAVFIVNTILSIPAMLLDLMTIQEMYVSQGLLSQIIWNVPHQEELTLYAFIASLLTWVVRVALMFFFNRLYYSKVINTIKSARDSISNESDYTVFLRKKGGVSVVGPIIVFAVLMAASFGVVAWMMTSPYFVLFQ